MQDPEGIFDRDPFLKRIKKAQDFSDADSIIKAVSLDRYRPNSWTMLMWIDVGSYEYCD